MRGKTIARIVVGVLVVGGAYVAFKDDIAAFWNNLHVKIAEYPQPKKTVWLDQGIAKEKLSWFYHADQGTRTFGFPYEWFMALEQPTIPWLIFTKVDDFSETAYLDRYGFIPDTIIPGKKALPIGFAKGGPMLDPSGAPWKNPRTKETMNGIGLTCAGCHTGRFTYKDTAVVIDGGPALTTLFTMKQGMGVSLLLTRFIPTRFRPLRREHPGTGFHGRRPRGAEGPAQPGPEAVRRSPGAGKARRFAEHPGRLRTAGRAEPDRQPGVFNRPEEAGKLRRLLRAGALSPDLEHAVVRLGAV